MANYLGHSINLQGSYRAANSILMSLGSINLSLIGFPIGSCWPIREVGPVAVAVEAAPVAFAGSLTGVASLIFDCFIIQLLVFTQLILIVKFNSIMSGFIKEYLMIIFIIPETECFKYFLLYGFDYKATEGCLSTSSSGCLCSAIQVVAS